MICYGYLTITKYEKPWLFNQDLLWFSRFYGDLMGFNGLYMDLPSGYD